MQAKDKLAAAENLTDKLGGEKVRWEQQVGGLEGQLKKLPVEALLAAAFMTYLPGQPEDFRRRMLSKWQVRVASFRAGVHFAFFGRSEPCGWPSFRRPFWEFLDMWRAKVAIGLLAGYLPATQAGRIAGSVAFCFWYT